MACPEARSTLARLNREGLLGDRPLRSSVADLERDLSAFVVVEIDASLARLAGELAERRALRGFDAIHIASALTLAQLVGEPPAFPTFDSRQAEAVAAEGLEAWPGSGDRLQPISQPGPAWKGGETPGELQERSGTNRPGCPSPCPRRSSGCCPAPGRCATNSTMSSIGIRELRQRASEFLRRVRAGETFEVTDRGRPVALLSPIPDAPPLEALRTAGEVDEATGDIGDLPEPLELQSGREPPSSVLERVRANER